MVLYDSYAKINDLAATVFSGGFPFATYSTTANGTAYILCADML